MSRPSGGISSFCFRRIHASFDRLNLIIDHAIRRVPYPPQPHFSLTVWTDQGVPTGALLVPLPVGHRGDDLDGPLDHALHLGQGLSNQAFDLCKRLGGLHAVLTKPMVLVSYRLDITLVFYKLN